MCEDKGRIFNIQHYSLHDGPGIRTLVFFKGCPLRCKWCSNPESQKSDKEIFYNKSKCIGYNECGECINICERNSIKLDKDTGKVIINRNSCNNCLKCAETCPSKAIDIYGEELTVNEILKIVEKDSCFYSRSGGGLTLSGGEPLRQGDFVIKLLKEAKKRRINTSIETCGYCDYSILKESCKYLDTLIMDIKIIDDELHKAYCGASNKIILDNFIEVCNDFKELKKIIRTPIIPGFNDNDKARNKINEFISNKENVTYELLPYHEYGKNKYKFLGREYWI